MIKRTLPAPDPFNPYLVIAMQYLRGDDQLVARSRSRRVLAAGVPFPQRLGVPDKDAKGALSTIDNDYLNGDVIRLDGALSMAPR